MITNWFRKALSIVHNHSDHCSIEVPLKYEFCIRYSLSMWVMLVPGIRPLMLLLLWLTKLALVWLLFVLLLLLLLLFRLVCRSKFCSDMVSDVASSRLSKLSSNEMSLLHMLASEFSGKSERKKKTIGLCYYSAG